MDSDYVVGYRPSARGIRFSVLSLIAKIGSGLVTSVFGRTGDVVAQAGDYAAADITGLGDSATKNVGTTAGTVAAGDHTHTTLTMTSITLICASDASSHTVTVKKDPDTGAYTLDLD